MARIQRPIWGVERLVNPSLTQHIFSLLSQPQYLYQLHLLNPLLLLHLIKLHPVNPLIVAKALVLNVLGHQLEEHLVSLSFLHSCMVYFLTYFFLRLEAPNYAKW